MSVVKALLITHSLYILLYFLLISKIISFRKSIENIHKKLGGN